MGDGLGVPTGGFVSVTRLKLVTLNNASSRNLTIRGTSSLANLRGESPGGGLQII